MNKYKVCIKIYSMYVEQIVEATNAREALDIAYNNIEYCDSVVLLEEGEEKEDE